MRNDDFHVIAFRALTYLYACVKKKIIFEGEDFFEVLGGGAQNKRMAICREYLEWIFKTLAEGGYINEFSGDYGKMEITMKGIEYLTDDYMMKKVKYYLHKYSDRRTAEIMNYIFL